MNLDDEELKATRGDKIQELETEVENLKNYLVEKGLISDHIRCRKSKKINE